MIRDIIIPDINLNEKPTIIHENEYSLIVDFLDAETLEEYKLALFKLSRDGPIYTKIFSKNGMVIDLCIV